MHCLKKSRRREEQNRWWKMDEILARVVDESLSVKKAFFAAHADLVIRTARKMAGCLAAGNNILIFGNGGSAADAQHLAAEFVNRFHIDRPPLAAVALTPDTSILTSIANDRRFDDVFATQVRALGRKGDLAVGISTSGNSPNVLNAVTAAAELGMTTVGLTGRGGRLAEIVQVVFRVNSTVTPRIQETHITLGHVLCELVDRILFPDAFEKEQPTCPTSMNPSI